MPEWFWITSAGPAVLYLIFKWVEWTVDRNLLLKSIDANLQYMADIERGRQYERRQLEVRRREALEERYERTHKQEGNGDEQT